VTDVEDFKSATARLLGKLPRIEAVPRAEGPTMPRLAIEAGPLRILAFAADAEQLRFHGLVESAGERPYGPWREFIIDADGNVVAEGRRVRIRRMDWDDSSELDVVRAWPEFAKARKVRSNG
jgi:hypothetical protein